MKDLILNGAWLKRDKGLFYRADIDDLRFFDNLDDLGRSSFSDKNYFIIISYDLSGELLDLNIKKSGLPPVVLIELNDFKEIFPEPYPCRLSLKGSSLNDDDYKNSVLKIKELIAEGTIYQVNLTDRFDFEFDGTPESLFYRFHYSQPVPYSFYLNAGDFYIISGSMELFLEKEGSLIRSKPIKGTATTAHALINSEKDRAENLMITDMMRNDLGRIARNGTVRVTELFRITEYQTLFQMHSTVEAISDKEIVDILRATFPPASVTGAPKRKAVEIIESLEPHPRSYYCGCAGLLSPEHDFILSVLIRTAIGNGKRLSYYAGCGIVWDSEPEKELSELYLKMKAFQSIEQRAAPSFLIA
ncbi:MAG: chorismate-binding protein [Thermodesulfovibrionales bacterium]